MNSVDKNIKYTAEIDWESNSLVFLDVIVSIDSEGFLRADLHTMPNSKNKLLLPSSAHAPSVTRSLVTRDEALREAIRRRKKTFLLDIVQKCP